MRLDAGGPELVVADGLVAGRIEMCLVNGSGAVVAYFSLGEDDAGRLGRHMESVFGKRGTKCDAWISHDDVGGDGEQTFYHECGGEEEHDEKHHCMGEPDMYSVGGWSKCGMEW